MCCTAGCRRNFLQIHYIKNVIKGQKANSFSLQGLGQSNKAAMEFHSLASAVTNHNRHISVLLIY